jgi:hypothetical protein
MSRNGAREFGVRIWSEKAFSEACDQVAEPRAGGDERALPRGPVRGRERLYPVERVGAPERERVRAALIQQRVEQRSHRNQTPSGRIDQPGVHSISRGQEPVLGKHLGARDHRRRLAFELEPSQ